MITLVFLLEDQSMKELLEGLLPRILPPPPEVIFQLIPHRGKADLDKSIPRKLRAWGEPRPHFVILRDQDSTDCVALKQRLISMCQQEGHPETLVRISCREVESWYIADLDAVDTALGTSVSSQQSIRKFRAPDILGSPSQELVGLVPSFGKVSGARALGPVLDLENTRSPSFAHFVGGLRRLVERLLTSPESP